MSKILVSILLLFLTFSLYGQEVKKGSKVDNPAKNQVVTTKKDSVKKEESKKKDVKEKKNDSTVKAKVKVVKKFDTKKESNLDTKSKAKLEAEKKAKLEAEKKAKLEAEKKAKLEAEKKAKLEAEKKAKLEAEKKAKLEAEKKAKLEEKAKLKLEMKSASENKKLEKDSSLGTTIDGTNKIEDTKKYGVSLVLDSALGQGTFVSNYYARDPLFAQTLSLSPNYKNWGVSFALNISASMEYTKSDSTTHANEILFSDLGLSASKGLYHLEDLGLSLRGSFKLALPTSLASQKATLIFAPLFSLQLAESLGKVSISYAVSFKKNFHKYTTPAISSDDLSDFKTYQRKNGAEILEKSLISTGGNNVSFSLSNLLALNYSITDSISTGINFAYSQAWTYRSFKKDDLTPDNAKTGRGYRDIIIGGIDLSWQINKTVGLSMGITTAQLPKTSNQKGFRFPWFNFSTPADNSSLFFLDINTTF